MKETDRRCKTGLSKELSGDSVLRDGDWYQFNVDMDILHHTDNG